MVPFAPIAGISAACVLMFSLPVENWWRLLIWLAIGFVIYFGYSKNHSALRKRNAG